MPNPEFSWLSRHGKLAFGLALACGVAASPLASGGVPAKPVLPPSDPGPAAGTGGLGGALPGLGPNEILLFNAAQARFGEVDSVSGTIDDAPPGQQAGVGLGPSFNGNSCQLCHIQPAIGGSSPAMNPQIALARLDGATNSIPPFITANGPTREARFISNPDGSADGGVHDLFVITGRSDAPGCTTTQPNFPAAMASNNVIFRIPTPLFGLGQVENTPDVNLINDAAAMASFAAQYGVSSGVFNLSGNDGTITRFGWKAQNKSLLVFSGEAYNVEQGVTNELFPNERDDTPGCQFNALPEDALNLTNPGTSGFAPSDFSSDIENFAAFMRLLAGPTGSGAGFTGAELFDTVGCTSCHIPAHVTGNSIFTNQSFVTYQPFSDFALHDMGVGLADGVNQGTANGSQFRTAPLWGAAERIFFLHDGRTSDIRAAIEAHASNGSEANFVIECFNSLNNQGQQAILNFLRSL